MNCIVLQHEEHEGLGLLEKPLRDAGFSLVTRFRSVEHKDLDAHLVVVMGLPASQGEGSSVAIVLVLLAGFAAHAEPLTRAVAQDILYLATEKAPACSEGTEPEQIVCLLKARYAKDAATQKLAISLYEKTGTVAGQPTAPKRIASMPWSCCFQSAGIISPCWAK